MTLDQCPVIAVLHLTHYKPRSKRFHKSRRCAHHRLPGRPVAAAAGPLAPARREGDAHSDTDRP